MSDWRYITGFACVGIPVLVLTTFYVVYCIGRISRRSNHRWKNERRARKGLGLGIDELARRLKLNPEQLRRFTPGYQAVTIPKRGGGVRSLDVPDAQTKSLQRSVLRLLLDKLKAHPTCHGFERGRSIVSNALPHVGQEIVIKLDIRDFFRSTLAERVEWYFRIIGWDAECAALLSRICCHSGGLPQGAPTSPRLANLVNYKMDQTFAKLARRCYCRYTRYADDLTFSCTWKQTGRPGTLARGIVQKVAWRLRKDGYELNQRKVRILRRHQQQRVTGLVVNDAVALPRATRRWLRAVEHRLRTGGAASLTTEQLQGWKAFAAMVDQQRQPPTEGLAVTPDRPRGGGSR